MVNTPLIKALIAKHAETQAELADALGMPASALNARINGHIEFRRNEINAIRNRYNLSQEETMAIFFNEAVS